MGERCDEPRWRIVWDQSKWLRSWVYSFNGTPSSTAVKTHSCAPARHFVSCLWGNCYFLDCVFELIRSFSIRMSIQYTLHSGEARQAWWEQAEHRLGCKQRASTTGVLLQETPPEAAQWKELTQYLLAEAERASHTKPPGYQMAS